MNAYEDSHPNKPKHSPMYGTLTHPKSGTITRLISSESPDRARGADYEVLFADECGAWAGDSQEFFHNLQYGLRMGVSQAILATTPRSTPLMIELVKAGRDPTSNVRLITGSTLENTKLSPQMLENAKRTMKTKFGRQEIAGELILTNDKACYTPELVERCKTKALVDFHPSKWVRACIGVDPSAGNMKKDSDKTGLVTAVLTESNKVLVIRDESARMTGQGAVDTIYDMYTSIAQLCPCKIRVEKNGAGSMYKDLIRKDHPFLPIEEFPSTVKKYTRLQACAYLYETGVVFHDMDADLLDLENEYVSYDGTGKSPDHADAACFAIDGLVTNVNFTSRKKFIL